MVAAPGACHGAVTEGFCYRWILLAVLLIKWQARHARKNGSEGEQFLPLYIDLHAPGGQRIGEIPSSSLFKHTQQELFAKNNMQKEE